jgi:uncharacterized protein
VLRIERDIALPAPPWRAFEVLTDAHEVVAAVPGATLTSWDGTAFEATVRVRLGLVPVVARGHGRLVSRDPAAARALVEITRRDGAPVAEVTLHVRADSGGAASVAVLRADVRLPAVAGRFGRSVATDLGHRMVDAAATALAARLADEDAVPAGASPGLVARLPGMAVAAAEVGAGITLAVARRLLGRRRGR